MPHDAKGREIKAGDVVVVPFKVTAVHQSEDHCNVNLESCATMPPDHTSKTSLANINTKMLLRANDGDDTSFGVLSRGSGEFHLISNDEPVPA